MVKVMVVDDSPFMRRVIVDMLQSDPEIQVTAVAKDGVEALEKLPHVDCQVITLDVEMPRMDGLAFLRQMMQVRPLPVVMLSSLTSEHSQTTLEALSLGAVDFVAKPGTYLGMGADDIRQELIRKVKAAVKAKVIPRVFRRPSRPWVRRSLPAQVQNLVAIAASTGGPRALEEILADLPGDLPAAVLITQHMPPGFTRSFADRLHRTGPLRVKEGEEGDALANGLAIIAPGDYHMVLGEDGLIHLDHGPPVEYVRPAADVMLNSLARNFPGRIIGVVLTGMGRDGARGMAAIKDRGGYVLAQDEETSTIFSMPKAVIEEGAAHEVLPLGEIAPAIKRLLHV
jgi:two-component system chemotaxis response regulator CheB